MPNLEKIKKEYNAEILKADEDKKIVTGVVLEPDTIDAHGDTMTMEEIEKTAHDFLVKSRTIGDTHKKVAQAELIESYVVPVDVVINKQEVKKGSWIISVKINDENTWKKVKSGFYNSFSVGGFGVREQMSKSFNKDKKLITKQYSAALENDGSASDIFLKLAEKVPLRLYGTLSYLWGEAERQNSESIELGDIEESLKQELEELSRIELTITGKTRDGDKEVYKDYIINFADTPQGAVVKFSDYLSYI